MTDIQNDSGEIPSETCETLTLLHGISAFARHLQLALSNAVRQVHIFSRNLDPQLLAHEDTCRLLSGIARGHRQAEIFILVRETADLVASSHRLVALQQRLPSKIHLRSLLPDIDAGNKAYVIVDGRQLLFQHEAGNYEGFCNTDAAPEAQALLDEFTQLWERQSEEVVEFRPLSL